MIPVLQGVMVPLKAATHRSTPAEKLGKRMSALYERARKLGLPRPKRLPLEKYEAQVIERLEEKASSR
jgi:hypothetical protein